MINFRHAFSGDSGKYISESGSMYLDQYEYEFDDTGEVKSSTLHKTKKPLNVYEKIQADFASTDINLLMSKFALGDTAALNVKEGIYADVTKMPSNFAELFERVNECNSLFDELPADVKQLFNNSVEEFWYSYGSEEFDKKIAEYNDRFVDHSFDEKQPSNEEGDNLDE